MRTMLAVVGVLFAVVPAAGCGDDDASPPTTQASTCRDAVAGRVTLVAKDLAWDTDCLSGPAGPPLVIVVDNRDEDVNHNLHLTTAPGEPSTTLEQGPVTQELAVTLPAGRYDYACDLHPTMVGRLVVG